MLAACGPSGERPTPIAPGTIGQVDSSAQSIKQLKAENAKLQAELDALRKQLEELKLTPQVLLTRVTDAIAADKADDARTAAKALDERFSGSAQATAAKSALAKYDAAAAAREAQANALEARGFFALQPQAAPNVNGVTIRVESLQLGNRWDFNSHEMASNYRDAERDERFVLMRTTLHSTDKDPSLPDVGVYRIDGKTMKRLAKMEYEFRRWSSYGTFIGLYHDYKNDFSHTASVPFNAAASISIEDAKKPFAVVATGAMCHDREKVIGQPEVAYRFNFRCTPKDELQTEDFAKGEYRVIAFFNRPKGS